MKKIYQLEVWIFGKMHHRIPFLSALRAPLRRFQMALKGLNFVKTLIKFPIIYATDPFLQNMTKIVCLCWLTFDIFNLTPVDRAQLYGAIFRNQYSLPHALSLKGRRWPPIFFCISGTSNSSSGSKNSIDWKIFARTSLKCEIVKHSTTRFVQRSFNNGLYF